MAKCDICGKGVTFGIKVSHSHRRSNRTWKPNVRRIRAVINGNTKSINICTRCLRSGKVTRAVWFYELDRGAKAFLCFFMQIFKKCFAFLLIICYNVIDMLKWCIKLCIIYYFTLRIIYSRSVNSWKKSLLEAEILLKAQ